MTVTPGMWIKALESGEYKKARGMLRNPNTGGMCCIGVLHHLVDPDTELDEVRTFKEYLLPDWVNDEQLDILARANDTQRGYPIEMIREMYCAS